MIEANPAERATIAALLDLVALDRLSFACRFYQARGRGASSCAARSPRP